MKRFSGCWFGPFELRGLLRTLGGEQGREKMIGWGTVQKRDGLGTSVAMALLGFVPAVGPLLAMSKAKDYLRFFLLTDRRLLVLRIDQRDPGDPKRPPECDIPLGNLVLGRTVEDQVFEVGVVSGGAGADGAVLAVSRRMGTYEVLRSQGGAPARLRAGLGVLAMGGDSARVY